MANNIRSKVKKTVQVYNQADRFDYKTNVYLRKREFSPLKLPKIKKNIAF